MRTSLRRQMLYGYIGGIIIRDLVAYLSDFPFPWGGIAEELFMSTVMVLIGIPGLYVIYALMHRAISELLEN